MLIEIEETCRFLIELAKSAKINMAKLLNHTTKSGHTLFHFASIISEKLAKQLLLETDGHGKKIVKVNSITDLFLTPFFRVRLI